MVWVHGMGRPLSGGRRIKAHVPGFGDCDVFHRLYGGHQPLGGFFARHAGQLVEPEPQERDAIIVNYAGFCFAERDRAD